MYCVHLYGLHVYCALVDLDSSGLELQDASQHLSWKAASANEVTFACYLANKLDKRVEWKPLDPDLIASAPDATLSALACQVKLPLSI